MLWGHSIGSGGPIWFCLVLWGHSIGSGGPIWFCLVLQAKISIPRGKASIYSFL